MQTIKPKQMTNRKNTNSNILKQSRNCFTSIIPFLIIFIFQINSLKSQINCPTDITFTSQVQIDNFVFNYFLCTEVYGNLTIEESVSGNITNISGLSVLTSIGGDLIVRNNSALSDVDDWGDLTSIGGDLKFSSNEAITSISGLSSLSSVGELIDFSSNAMLINLDGLENITSVNGKLNIFENAALINLDGLSNITSVGDKLSILLNNNLTTLEGLNNISDISGTLYIGYNENLTSLDALSGIIDVGNDILISSNTSLANIDGLTNLGYIGGGIRILTNPIITNVNVFSTLTELGGKIDFFHNNALNDISGIENINASTITQLRIKENVALSICEVQSICDYLEITNADITISDNASGCNSDSEVDAACNPIPLCTSLVSPMNGAIDVSIIASLNWNAAMDATSYLLTVGSSPGASNILNNLDVGNVLVYSSLVFSCDETVYVTIVPINDNGNALGCIEESFMTEGVIAVASNDVEICIGSNTQLLASGGTDYLWFPTTGLDNPNIANPIASPTVTTVYSVLVMDGNCEDEDEVEVIVNIVSGGFIESDQSICSGLTSNIINQSPNGEGNGYGDLSYQWQSSTTSCSTGFVDITGETSINYNPGILTETTFFRRMDSRTTDQGLVCGPISTNCITISVHPNPVPNAFSTNETAYNATDGTATANPTIGIAPFTYLWSNDETSQTITNLAPGIYNLELLDGNNCIAFDTVEIQEYVCNTLTIIDIKEDIHCYSFCDGTITVSGVTNGVPPLTYSWSNGSTSSTISDLCVGIYDVTVTDSKNCSIINSYTISEPSELVLNISSTHETSNDANDGTATCIPTGGALPYYYLWENGETTQTIIGLPSGSYSVVVTDDNNCSKDAEVVVNSFDCPILEVELAYSDISCAELCNSIIIVENVINGTYPLSYMWNTGATTQMIDSLCEGNYSVTIIDGGNCIAIGAINIDAPSTITANTLVTSETGSGSNDGTAIANPEGGTGSYTYLWSSSDTTQSIVNLSPGSYTVTVTDSNGCEVIETVIVVEYGCQSLVINTSQIEISCYGSCDGRIIIDSITNGHPPFNHLWSTGDSVSYIEYLCAGDYSITSTDGNNCQVVQTITISEPDEINITVDSIGNIESETPGFISLTTNDDYIFNWSGPQGFTSNQLDISDLDVEGCYTLIVTDTIQGCSTDSTFCITEIVGLSEAILDLNDILIYPNPCSNVFNIEFKNQDIEITSISIQNITGQTCYTLKKPTLEIHQIDTKQIDSGLYLIVVKSKNKGTIVKKIVKTDL